LTVSAIGPNHPQTPENQKQMTATENSPKDGISTRVTILNKKGLHARAAAAFVKALEPYNAEITVCRDQETVSGHSIMDLLLLAAGKGTDLTINASGPDAETALKTLQDLVERKFDEE
jgi:phosphocarrier protein